MPVVVAGAWRYCCRHAAAMPHLCHYLRATLLRHIATVTIRYDAADKHYITSTVTLPPLMLTRALMPLMIDSRALRH